ncbi:MAG: DUF4268 domain-containing protein [Pseudorhodoplanes sp.]
MTDKTSVRGIGRLERSDLRSVWSAEAVDFTPWLALPENLTMLGETLGLELDLEAQERAVGPFRADILCRDVIDGHWVLIENQLERTDHVHLGQLLTYAAGLEAATIIWVAARFTEEHRAALDWLNKITDDSFRFFGLEVELWRIGESLPAPKFNIVAKPNDWSHAVAQAARALDESELSATRIFQRNYWASFLTRLASIGGPINANRKPPSQAWMTFSTGRSEFHLNTVMSQSKKQIRVELYLLGDYAKRYFHALREQQFAIEQEFGYGLDWDELPSRRDCRIARRLADADPANESEWSRQHEWLASRLTEMRCVFSPRIDQLNPDTIAAAINGVSTLTTTATA